MKIPQQRKKSVKKCPPAVDIFNLPLGDSEFLLYDLSSLKYTKLRMLS